MSESYGEQLARVKGMAAGDPTWDLSDNDTAALTAVLGQYQEILADLKVMLDQIDDDPRVVQFFDLLLLAKIQNTIAKAEGARIEEGRR